MNLPRRLNKISSLFLESNLNFWIVLTTMTFNSIYFLFLNSCTTLPLYFSSLFNTVYTLDTIQIYYHYYFYHYLYNFNYCNFIENKRRLQYRKVNNLRTIGKKSLLVASWAKDAPNVPKRDLFWNHPIDSFGTIEALFAYDKLQPYSCPVFYIPSTIHGVHREKVDYDAHQTRVKWRERPLIRQERCVMTFCKQWWALMNRGHAGLK